MSKDIIVLVPNGRRQKVQCTPDTNFLQILEDVCHKQGFQPSDYDLKHHNHILDLTMTLRFSNLPNKAMIEMVETEQKRKESNVTIGLQLEDGERRTADFATTTTLYELVEMLAPSEMSSIQQPTIMYMRQEVIGETALKEKTLRQLGLISGRAILRLLNKPEEAGQANVSSVYRKAQVTNITAAMAIETPDPEESRDKHTKAKNEQLDLISKLKAEQHNKNTEENKSMMVDETTDVKHEEKPLHKNKREKFNDAGSCTTSGPKMKQEHLERRLKIEEEVTFLGSQKGIAFMQPEDADEELADLPDDFYDLSIEEVRKLYNDLQQSRITLENIPLLPSAQVKEKEQQVYQEKLGRYKNAVVRIQFPDGIILQGIFTPTDTIEDVTKFIKEYLHSPNRKFHIFSTPLKETLKLKMTLLEARFVPCVHMHFKWLDEKSTNEQYLKQEIYSKTTPSDAANILASKYRAPNRRTQDDSKSSLQTNKPSTSKSSKTPKWFKNK